VPLSRIAIFVALALILGVPFALRPASPARASGPVQRLVVVTPHVPQIRAEFATGFSTWHERHYGAPVSIDYRAPGGTSEILTQLESQYQAAAKTGQFDLSDPNDPKAAPGAIPFDLVFGGGSYDHTRIKNGVKIERQGPDGKPQSITIPMSIPAGFTQQELDGWFGENAVGAQKLYDPEQYWIGVALSGFGIVYNRIEYQRLTGRSSPETFDDLADPKLLGMVILADPRQSGSVATTLDSILSNYGWDKGWRLLREICGNSRAFTNSSPKPPIDVSQGEGAAGLAIDFYGRGQSQAVLAPGQKPEDSRVGYVDPKGATYIDADPVTILRGCPHPKLAKHFVEFCLSEEGQALWQLPARTDPRSANNPKGEDGQPLGPQQYELRRMPARRMMYEKYVSSFIDKANPFEIASKTKPAGWRAGIGPMMGAFAIDNAHLQRQAWKALCDARADTSFPSSALAQMESLFYAFPITTLPDGSTLPFTADNFKAIAAAWKSGGTYQARCEIAYTRYIQENYERIIALGGSHGDLAGALEGSWTTDKRMTEWGEVRIKLIFRGTTLTMVVDPTRGEKIQNHGDYTIDGMKLVTPDLTATEFHFDGDSLVVSFDGDDPMRLHRD
jgi:ABC-type Fe3+ transport system substrate-binding protein